MCIITQGTEKKADGVSHVLTNTVINTAVTQWLTWWYHWWKSHLSLTALTDINTNKPKGLPRHIKTTQNNTGWSLNTFWSHVSGQSNHTTLAVVPVMGAQATSVCIEMPASMDLGSADTGVKIKWSGTGVKQDGQRKRILAYSWQQSVGTDWWLVLWVFPSKMHLLCYFKHSYVCIGDLLHKARIHQVSSRLLSLVVSLVSVSLASCRRRFYMLNRTNKLRR